MRAKLLYPIFAGAVIAREYGLPCLVGVQNVKKHLKTGRIVKETHFFFFFQTKRCRRCMVFSQATWWFWTPEKDSFAKTTRQRIDHVYHNNLYLDHNFQVKKIDKYKLRTIQKVKNIYI